MVFYVTQGPYACSALINIDRLRKTFNSTYPIVVFVKPGLQSSFLDLFTAYNATVVLYEPPPIPINTSSYYTGVLLKLVSFRLHQIIPSLNRVLVLDSDQLILQSPDHLFSLPVVDLAAPRAYWSEDPTELTSALMLIKPSDRSWRRVKQAMDEIKPGEFDMDIINTLFGRTALVLPGEYCTLNTQWEVNEVPRWWQGQEPLRDPSWRPKLNSSAFTKPLVRWSESKRSIIIDSKTAPEMTPEESMGSAARERYKTALANEELQERAARLKDTLTDVYNNNVKMLHYTAYGKPWNSPSNEVRERRKWAHPLFSEQMATWREAARNICPGYEEISV
ncbi:uncharacterized protein KY384_005410 [Bacidia gigantensis]|uniref:uncharacterized protein n=1 Tax=Bacidia gigantensis TaxID=2732470 RepID=UPI001D04DA49|nr:uncharacterized protein KY384_005410 [Bacidia gigantensis]KAG8529929.1 hypothetical protein KY384_005410 [Bacidia gigantensis]